jgi:hypothetical protein
LEDGAVMVSGSLHAERGKVALVRFRQDGALTPTFGLGGWKLHAPKQRLFAPLLAMQDDGKPVVAAAEPYGVDGSRAGFRVIRFLRR